MNFWPGRDYKREFLDLVAKLRAHYQVLYSSSTTDVCKGGGKKNNHRDSVNVEQQAQEENLSGDTFALWK